MDPFWAPIIVEAFKNAERYDKIRRYIRAGTVSQLFPWGDGSKWPEAITEQDMLNVVDNHIDELPENWYKP